MLKSIFIEFELENGERSEQPSSGAADKMGINLFYHSAASDADCPFQHACPTQILKCQDTQILRYSDTSSGAG